MEYQQRRAVDRGQSYYGSEYNSNHHHSSDLRNTVQPSFDQQIPNAGTRDHYYSSNERNYNQPAQFSNQMSMNNQSSSYNSTTRNIQSSSAIDRNRVGQPDDRFVYNQYPDQSRNEYYRNDTRNVGYQMQEMHIQDQNQPPQNHYHLQNQDTNQRPSTYSPNVQLNNNNNRLIEERFHHAGDFRDNSFGKRNDYRQYDENAQSSNANFPEQTHFQQIGKPQVLANTSGDGGSVAVFGVVAQVQKSPTNRDAPNTLPTHQGDSHGPRQLRSQDNLNRAQHLSPIVEHPNSPSSLSHLNSTNFNDYSRQGYAEKRYPPQPLNPNMNTFQQRSVISKEHDRQLDVYRDEYTDSSGYGSTLTDRSYEGPMHLQPRINLSKPNYYQQQQQAPLDRNEFQFNDIKQQQQRHQQPSSRYSTNQSNFSSIPVNDEPPKQWPNHGQQLQRRSNQYQHNSYQQNSVDDSRIKGVQSVKKMFDKPNTMVPLPPTSSSYGANQYNTRPLPPRPQSHVIGKNISSGPPPQQDYYSPPDDKQYASQQFINQQSSNYNYHGGNPSNELHHSSPSNDYRQPRPPGQSMPENAYHDEKGLPYYDPPPQHSQSMSNLDNLYSEQSRNPSVEVRSRSSYTNGPNENDMVVGVRFEKGHPLPSRQDPNQISSMHKQESQQRDITNDREPSENWLSPVNNLPPPSQQPHMGRTTYPYNEIQPEREQSSMSYPRMDSNDYHRSATSSNYPPDSYPGREPLRSPDQPTQHQQHQYDSRSQHHYVEDSRNHRSYDYEQPREQASSRPGPVSQEPVEENYVPDIVKKSYGLYTQSKNQNNPPQSLEEWPEPPPPNVDQRNVSQPPRQQNRNFDDSPPNDTKANHTTSYQVKQVYRVPERPQIRQEPTGGNNLYQYRQAPSHPFDPTDDDSSDEVNVDAPTPPITDRNRHWGREGRVQVEERNYGYSSASTTRTNEQRPVPAGEKYQNSRQPGDGLNDASYPPPGPPDKLQTPATSRSIPHKPSRNSLKQVKANSDQSQQETNSLDHLDEHSGSNLNHDHSKERARLSRAGKVTRKPPSRRNSSNVLPEVHEDNSNSDYEINVTSRDLTRQQASQPIKVQFTQDQSDRNQRGSRTKQQTIEPPHTDYSTSSKPPHVETSTSNAPKSEPRRAMKLAFKTPPPGSIPKNPAHILPDVQERNSKDKKIPPTYTGTGSAAKPQTTLTPDLLGLFNSSRDDALRSAAKKQTRALHSVHAAVRLRRTDQSQPRKDTRRTENQDIYNNSKPKHSRDKDESDSRRHDDRRGRDDEMKNDKGRSSGRSKTRSPERRDRARDRDMDRNRDSKKSDRSDHRPVSPPRGGRDEAPYRQREEPPHPSRHGDRSDEPEWVEQYRKKRATNEHSPKKRDWAEDPKWRQKKEFDFDQYKRDVKKATSYSSDFEQPVRKQVIPAKLLSAKGRAPPSQRPPQGNNDWMKNLKEQNKRANRNRFGNLRTNLNLQSR